MASRVGVVEERGDERSGGEASCGGGADYSEIIAPQWSGDDALDAYLVVPEVLLPDQRTRWDAAMQERFEADIDHLEDILFETRIDDDDEWEMVQIVDRWAEAKDVRQPGGRSWFDAFLARLKNDRWHRDYLVTTGASHSFLDTLYEEVDQYAGTLNAIIGQNSVEFGFYRPASLAYTETGAPATTLPGSAQAYIDKTADLVMDRLEGFTSADDSKVITDAMAGLGKDEQRAVLRNIVERDPGDYGEAWQGGMLYWLFEDLYSSDREYLASKLTDTGALTDEMAKGLAAGRGIAGKYLPYTTHKGEEAAQYWADRAVAAERQGETSYSSWVMGSFASLWTPHTAAATVVTLVTAGAATPETGAFAVLGDFAASQLPTWLTVPIVLGATGYAGYEVGISGQKAIFGKDPYTGKELDDGERIAAVLHTISGALFLGIGFAGGPEEELATSGAPKALPGTVGEPPLLGPGVGGPKVVAEWRVSPPDPVTGEVSGVLVDNTTGEVVGHMRLDPRTGNGSATNLVTGETMTVVGGQPFRPSGLLGAGDPKNTGTLVSVGGDVASADVLGAEADALAGMRPAIEAPGTTVIDVGPKAFGEVASESGESLSAVGQPRTGEWYELDSAVATVAPPEAPRQLLLGEGEFPTGTVGAELGRDSLDTLELRYGRAIRDRTGRARTQRDLQDIADTLPEGIASQYKGDLGEMLLRDSAPKRGLYSAKTHGASNEPGVDAPMVTLQGEAEIVLGESKLGTGKNTYRIGEGGMPRAYRVVSELYDQLYAIIRNPNEPLIVRIRMKAALDEGRIRWQLNEYGNVKVKVRGSDRFPGDVEVVVPFNIPRQ